MEQENYIPADFSIKALQNGDERVFEAVFVQYYQALAFFAAQMVKDQSTAKEIVQEVFVKLWERKKMEPDILNIKSYLYTATRNHCLNYLDSYSRKQRKAEEYGYMAPQSEDGILREIIRSETLWMFIIILCCNTWLLMRLPAPSSKKCSLMM